MEPGAGSAHRPTGGGPRLVLLEQRDSAYVARIGRAATLAGLSMQHLDQVEAAPADARLIGIGPALAEPLEAARQLRRAGSRALLVFFTGSSAACAALQAELIRDPFLYPRCELIEVPDTAHQLAARMGRVMARVEHQSHLAGSAPRGRSRRLRPQSIRRQGSMAGEPYLSNILAQASEAIFVTNRAAQITSWNRAAEDLFGLSAEAALGRSLEFLTADDAPADSVWSVARRVLATGEVEQVHVTCRSGADAERHVAISVAPVRDPDGALLGLSVIARDDAEYQRIEAKLREANRQKDEFLAIMSHELRTPLTSILGYTDMLLRGMSGPLEPLTNRYLGNVRSAGDRLLELVNGLLDYTRLEAGVERLELRPVDLSHVVGEVVKHFQHQAQANGIDLRMAVGKGVAAGVEADEDKLTHAVRSIVGNALKFTPQNGWVAVHIGPDPETREAVRVSVADSGIGISSEVLPRVWERFYQGDATLTRPYGGMGLGLSIARHLVTLHGGSVGAASRGPGLGSTFWFSLPLGQLNP